MAVSPDRLNAPARERLEALVASLIDPHRCASPTGIGIDHVDIARIERHVSATSLLEQITTREERSRWRASRPNDCKRETVAELVACKEAVAKATGMGLGERLGWSDVIVPPDPTGPLRVELRLDADLEIQVASLTTDDCIVAVAAAGGRETSGDGRSPVE